MASLSKRVSIIPLLFVCSFLKATECIQIFYDKVPDAKPEYTDGRAMAGFLQNLLGHFPQYQQKITPVEHYVKGQLSECFSNFYIGTYFSNKIPQTFVDDFTTTQSRVAWMGYNIWSLGDENLKKLWGVKYLGQSQLNWKKLDAKKQPGFYRFFDYKGEVFEKYAELLNETDMSTFQGAFETDLFEIVDPEATNHVVSWARHSTESKKTPYLIQKNQKWLIGDMPFSYLTEDDRYLIFADVLFDILAERPKRSKKIAVVRLEDVHAKVPELQMSRYLSLFKKYQIPFSISVIPVFADPYLVIAKKEEDKLIELPKANSLVKFLQDSLSLGASLIMHGATHQADMLKNPYGVSGFDYEFWNDSTQSPLESDGIEMVMNRLEYGYHMFEKVGLKPSVWITPHYAASPLDNLLFAQSFEWNMGRVNYTLYDREKITELPESLTLDEVGTGDEGKRLGFLSKMKVNLNKNAVSNGQFFPYEIYGDYNNARIVPEDIGFLQPPEGNATKVDASVLLKRLKRNLVLRDTWGSFFVHPYLAGSADDTYWLSEVEKLISGAKDLGYEFINLGNWARENKLNKRPEAIEFSIEK